MKIAHWLFIVDFFILMWIGSQHPETPFVEIGQFATLFYFSWFLIIVPIIGIIENTLFDLSLINNSETLSNSPVKPSSAAKSLGMLSSLREELSAAQIAQIDLEGRSLDQSQVKKTLIRRIIISVEKGLIEPTLPPHLIELEKNVYIKLLKVLGVTGILLSFTKSLDTLEKLLSGNLYHILLLICLISNLLLVFYLCYINYYRFIHMYKVLATDALFSENRKMSSLACHCPKTSNLTIAGTTPSVGPLSEKRDLPINNREDKIKGLELGISSETSHEKADHLPLLPLLKGRTKCRVEAGAQASCPADDRSVAEQKYIYPANKNKELFSEIGKRREFSTYVRLQYQFNKDETNLSVILKLDKLNNTHDKTSDSTLSSKLPNDSSSSRGESKIKSNKTNLSAEPLSSCHNRAGDVFNETHSSHSAYLIYDGINNKDIMNRVGSNGIYKVYKILLDEEEVFIKSLTDILEEIYDNNEFTIFKLYFLLKPDMRRVQKYDLPALINHLSNYPQEGLNEVITKVYKNTGLLITISVLVRFSNYDENNLRRISRDIKKEMKENINKINNTVKLDYNNSIINFIEKVENNSELILVITADFTNEILEKDRKQWVARFNIS
jgi:hypothetical protein